MQAHAAHSVPSTQREVSKRSKAKKFFHAEGRGKCFSSSTRNFDEFESSVQDNRSLQQSDASFVGIRASADAQHLMVEREDQNNLQERQRTLREGHARELLRGSTALLDFAAVQRMPAAFVPRAAIPAPDVQLKVIIFTSAHVLHAPARSCNAPSC